MRYQERLFTAGRGPISASTRRSRKSLFKVLKKAKPTRNLQLVEVYQRLYRPKIKEEVLRRGHGEMNEEAEARSAASSEPVIMSPEETIAHENAALKRVLKARSKRMSLWRNTSLEMLDGESDDVKEEVRESAAEVNRERAAGGEDPDEDGERTPEQLQQ